MGGLLPDSHAFLRLVRDTGLQIITKRVPGPGTFTRYQDGAHSTLDLLLANPKLFVLTTSYKVDSDCQYNVISDHRLVMAHTTLHVLTPTWTSHVHSGLGTPSWVLPSHSVLIGRPTSTTTYRWQWRLK